MESSTHMKPFAAFLLGSVMLAAGCTSQQLRRSTVNTASTITALQYQQVLDNLAMFYCNPEAMPWHAKLQNAVVQITDHGSGQLAWDLPTQGPVHWLPLASAGRSVVAQWQVNPTVDSDELDSLRLAYSRAVNPADADGALRRAIYKEIAEISTEYSIVLAESTVDELIKVMQQEAGTDKDKLEELEKSQKDVQGLYKQLRAALGENDGGQDRDRCIAQILALTGRLIGLPYLTIPSAQVQQPQSPTDITAAQGKIQARASLVEDDDGKPNKFSQPWLGSGCKKEVPKGACLVGRCGKCFVWVMPDKQDVLREFTLIILSLAPSRAQSNMSSISFTPGA
jgi:hypothetical protein